MRIPDILCATFALCLTGCTSVAPRFRATVSPVTPVVGAGPMVEDAGLAAGLLVAPGMAIPAGDQEILFSRLIRFLADPADGADATGWRRISLSSAATPSELMRYSMVRGEVGGEARRLTIDDRLFMAVPVHLTEGPALVLFRWETVSDSWAARVYDEAFFRDLGFDSVNGEPAEPPAGLTVDL